VFGVQRDDMWLWEENGRRWQALDLDTATRAQVDGYMSLAAQFATTSTEVLALAGEITGGTISKVMAKSDLELASRPSATSAPDYPTSLLPPSG
jgi:hypothetical protein